VSTVTIANDCSSSTTWEFRKVRIPGRPKGHVAAAAKRPPLTNRDLRTVQTLVVKYRGGAEAWWEIKARGRIYRMPGWVALHDAMVSIYGDGQSHEC
jgi:hypothetical protein